VGVATVSGLGGLKYEDNTAGNALVTEPDAPRLSISGEVDRVYLNARPTVTLHSEVRWTYNKILVCLWAFVHESILLFAHPPFFKPPPFLSISGEVDRVYLNARPSVTLHPEVRFDL